ncbi:MAG: hypothetical protein U9O94_02360, partial [Nanoarchaeota archaeon]|nr:hypothetical protein [Nanoarchaeota archaeon]
MNEQTQIPETNEPTTSNPTETTTPSTEPTTDWKEPIMQRTSLEPFATKAENKDDYIANLENGYENLSSKMGAKKEALLGDIPKEASGYELEGEGIDWYKDLAHQSNLTKDQAKAVQENFNTYMEEQSKVRETEFTDGLKQKWGDDFEGNFDKAKEFMADNLSKEEAKKLEGLDNVRDTLSNPS